MEIINTLNGSGIYQVLVVLMIVGVMETIKVNLLNAVLITLKHVWMRFLILASIAFVLSLIITALFFITDFKCLVWLRASFFNWLISYVFYDAVKNLIIKPVERKNQ
jgi:hypothetical protein